MASTYVCKSHHGLYYKDVLPITVEQRKFRKHPTVKGLTARRHPITVHLRPLHGTPRTRDLERSKGRQLENLESITVWSWHFSFIFCRWLNFVCRKQLLTNERHQELLDDFTMASGQRINLLKSRIFFSPNVSKDEASRISNETGIPITEDFGTYVGTQMVHHQHGKALYAKLLDRSKKKMNGWKGECLSLTGRITLAKSVLSSLPVFQMQTSPMPASVTREIDKQVRRFIWGRMEGRHKSTPHAGKHYISQRREEDWDYAEHLKWINPFSLDWDGGYWMKKIPCGVACSWVSTEEESKGSMCLRG